MQTQSGQPHLQPAVPKDISQLAITHPLGPLVKIYRAKSTMKGVLLGAAWIIIIATVVTLIHSFLNLTYNPWIIGAIPPFSYILQTLAVSGDVLYLFQNGIISSKRANQRAVILWPQVATVQGYKRRGTFGFSQFLVNEKNGSRLVLTNLDGIADLEKNVRQQLDQYLEIP